jgi:hypothetical protein
MWTARFSPESQRDMSTVGKPGHVTQNRVIALFRNELRSDNSNIEEKLLTVYLTRAGYSPERTQARLVFEYHFKGVTPNAVLRVSRKSSRNSRRSSISGIKGDIRLLFPRC